MELILLNIGLERGIIRPPLFSILVMMAIVTTLMATPVFERVYGKASTRTPPGTGGGSANGDDLKPAAALS
jgi:Kef-type K+ transport system membrane component KefB